ncbi:hypothetical protein [Candidatus Nitrosotalea okcheonensis]|uniref:Uncharacterized protein n=1 Tax=Candidatus Nitrosotalea okcheonensis TaxID=1903276 RepID=A0A2H1FIS0_9ARCH|nr:hypothetical protein [Candidatus Nitrosotalea okcheonensis]SMH72662.1 protein of unknown function [Candidatus Nitrosotalea okcheonensis]
MKTLHFQKLSVKVVTITLFSFGIIGAVLIGYNYFTIPHVISKQQSIVIAIRADNWTQQDLENTTVDAELLQAKLSNHMALVINETTLTTDPFPRMAPLPPRVFEEDQMFWDVIIKKHLKGMEYEQWQYLIDAKNSTMLEKMDP